MKCNTLIHSNKNALSTYYVIFVNFTILLPIPTATAFSNIIYKYNYYYLEIMWKIKKINIIIKLFYTTRSQFGVR